MHPYVKKGLVTLAGIAAFMFASEKAEAQQGRLPPPPDGIERLLENYSDVNVFRHRFDEGESLRNIQDELKTENYDKLQWLLDTYNTPISEGDLLTVVETANDRNIHYPVVLELDYADPRKQDELFIGEPSGDTGFAFTIDYHDSDGDLRRRLWTNYSRDPGLFDITLKDIEFPLEGYMDDYIISSFFGNRENPLPSAGGPDANDHKGTDWKVNIGTPIYAPADGLFNAGYGRRNLEHKPEYLTDAFLGKFGALTGRRIIRDQDRRTAWERLGFLFYHLDGFEESLKEDLIQQRLSVRNPPENLREEYREWYDMILSEKDEEKILDNLRGHGIHSIIMSPVQVRQNQLLGYTGDTGLSSGPHLHLGILVNGEYVDPIEFYEENGQLPVYSPEEMHDKIETYQNLIRRFYRE
ncbi:MAG: M23 family metallopeptidase [Nanoarchaeota archaeon]